MTQLLNGLTLEVYSSGTTRAIDIDGDLPRASGLTFATGYPGGLYLDASFYCARDVVRAWQIKGAQRLVIKNGQQIVWEGVLDNLERALDAGGQGILVTATGYWGAMLMRRRLRKRWADDRITDDVWVWDETRAGAPKCLIDRDNRIRFTPKAEAWTNGQVARVIYSMPTGQTIKRITFDYNLQEGAQAWELRMYNVTAASYFFTVTVSGTGSSDYTLATPTQQIYLELAALANQTPTSDGTYYGQVTNLTVRSESSAINLTEIATDIVGILTDLNSTTSAIGSNTYSLIPFIADGWETYADILTMAAGFGDSSQNRWAVGVLASDKAPSPDGKPVLFVEQYPALTDYDYAVHIGEINVVPPLSYSQAHDNLWNWIIVEYTDAMSRTQYVTPDDDSTLKDTTSITKYGQREYVLSVGEATQAMAINYGRRFLAARKDPEWRVTAPITVIGYVRSKSGDQIPASQIRAGKRIKIQSHLDDLSGTGLTLLISRTSYSADTDTCSIEIGPPDDLLIAPFSHPDPEEVDDDAGGGGGGGSGGKKRGPAHKWRKWGFTSAEWEKMSAAERRYWNNKKKKTG